MDFNWGVREAQIERDVERNLNVFSISQFINSEKIWKMARQVCKSKTSENDDFTTFLFAQVNVSFIGLFYIQLLDSILYKECTTTKCCF